MNDSKNSSKGFLALRLSQVLTREELNNLVEAITPTAESLGLQPMVLGDGADVRIEKGTDAFLERVCEALEEIAAQGRAHEVSEAPQERPVLNARPTGLNSRVPADKLPRW